MEESSEQFGRTIQLFLVNGHPNGLIVASIHGWTGSVLVSSQSTFSRLRSRPETIRSGVYILYGPDPDDPFLMKAYIGEAETVRDRINQSASEKGFWETAVAITTSDDALTKGHIQYLEARLIELARSAERVKLENTQAPDAGRRRLPESDKANMEAFLANLKVILPVVGIDFLKPKPKATFEAVSSNDHQEGPIFELVSKRGISAKATEEDGEFVVLKGSQALKDAGYSENLYKKLKNEMISKKVLLEDNSQDCYVFQQSFAFTSPSAAASVVLDRNANGRTEWKIAGTRQTYHEWQDQQASPADETE